MFESCRAHRRKPVSRLRLRLGHAVSSADLCPPLVPKRLRQEDKMAALMTAQTPGATQEIIDGLRPILDGIRSEKGIN